MAKNGRPKTPTVLRMLHGNPTREALPPAPVDGVGVAWKPPEWLDEEQREEWHYAVEHAPPGLLTGTDRGTLAIWCCASVEFRRAVLDVRRDGQIATAGTGRPIQNPSVAVMHSQALLMLKAGGEMGFSPAARASLGNRAAEFGTNGPTARSGSPQLTAYLDGKPDQLDS